MLKVFLGIRFTCPSLERKGHLLHLQNFLGFVIGGPACLPCYCTDYGLRTPDSIPGPKLRTQAGPGSVWVGLVLLLSVAGAWVPRLGTGRHFEGDIVNVAVDCVQMGQHSAAIRSGKTVSRGALVSSMSIF